MSLVLTAGGCGAREGAPSVRVLAAASTKESLEDVAHSFSQETGIEVKVSPGPSNGLARQIEAGAPADLFVSADEEWADAVARAGLEARRKNLLTNRLVLVVPAGNPAGVHSPEDLLRPTVTWVALAGEGVPAGTYAREALESLSLAERLRQQKKIVPGHDVRSTLSYVERGEVEGGIVYATDARISSKVEVVYTFPARTHHPIVYTVTLLPDGAKKEAARRFYEYLLSDAAARTFEKHGFQRPEK
jgi:molybdate transport system substrate-binding protein